MIGIVVDEFKDVFEYGWDGVCSFVGRCCDDVIVSSVGFVDSYGVDG